MITFKLNKKVKVKETIDKGITFTVYFNKENMRITNFTLNKHDLESLKYLIEIINYID